MTWRPHFGDRIEYSANGLQALNPRGGQRRGVVCGGAHSPDHVAVLWDGRKCRERYAVAYLAPAGLEPLETLRRCPVHARMIELAKAGLTVRQIAAEVGRCPQAIYPVLRKAGIRAYKQREPGPKPSFWTAERCAELSWLWNSGEKCSVIAAVIGCSANAVIGKAHRMKLAARNSPIIRRAA